MQQENIIKEQNELTQILNEFNSKINNYMQTLKKKSSEEILNGSVTTAQRMLDKLLLVEEGVGKVNSAHEYFIALLEHDEFPSAPRVDKINIKELNEDTKDGFKFDFVNNKKGSRLRFHILKALIYLGGNAEESEIIEFINKESGKNSNKTDVKYTFNDSTWVKEMNLECKNMIGENLLIFDNVRENWEITQNGIDYLARQEN